MFVKLNKYKHLAIIPVFVLLLFSLNLNTFAAETKVVPFSNVAYSAFYNPSSGGNTDITSSVTRSSKNETVNGNSIFVTSFNFPTLYRNFRKGLIMNPTLNLYTNTRYSFDFYVNVGNQSGTCSVLIQLWFGDSNDSATDAISIYDNENLSSFSWQHLTGEFTTTNASGTTKCFMVFIINSEVSTTTFKLTDIHITNVDPLQTGKPIETPSDDDLNNAIKDYDDVMSQLPSIDGDELDNIMNFDFSAFTDGMSFVRDMFERVMSTFGFNAILVFALTIGLATYIIGRKVG